MEGDRDSCLLFMVNFDHNYMCSISRFQYICSNVMSINYAIDD